MSPAADPSQTDVDPQAMRASEANTAANDVVATFVLPDALAAGTFDLVVARRGCLPEWASISVSTGPIRLACASIALMHFGSSTGRRSARA